MSNALRIEKLVNRLKLHALRQSDRAIKEHHTFMVRNGSLLNYVDVRRSTKAVAENKII
jgi:hypothetical protein